MKCRISRFILTEKYFLIFWKTNILIFFYRENVNIFQFLDSFTKFLVTGHIPKNEFSTIKKSRYFFIDKNLLFDFIHTCLSRRHVEKKRLFPCMMPLHHVKKLFQSWVTVGGLLITILMAFFSTFFFRAWFSHPASWPASCSCTCAKYRSHGIYDRRLGVRDLSTLSPDPATVQSPF